MILYDVVYHSFVDDAGEPVAMFDPRHTREFNITKTEICIQQSDDGEDIVFVHYVSPR